jgi:hypothetical protein
MLKKIFRVLGAFPNLVIYPKIGIKYHRNEGNLKDGACQE